MCTVVVYVPPSKPNPPGEIAGVALLRGSNGAHNPVKFVNLELLYGLVLIKIVPKEYKSSDGQSRVSEVT